MSKDAPDAVGPEAFGTALGPLLAAESDPVPTGLSEDAIPTPLNPYFREQFFHRVYEPHDGFDALELASRDGRRIQLYTHRGRRGVTGEVFIHPDSTPSVTGSLLRHVGNRWNYYRHQVTDHPGALRNMELNAHPAIGVRIADVSYGGPSDRKEWGSITVDPDRVPELISGLERAVDELTDADDWK